jgi:cbb3-type cytochrome oxidase maturation protein
MLSQLLFAAGRYGPDNDAPLSGADIALFATVIGSMLLFGGGAVLALSWAFKNRQFENFDRGANSIFDADEPVGEPTDAFPAGRVRVTGRGPNTRREEPA